MNSELETLIAELGAKPMPLTERYLRAWSFQVYGALRDTGITDEQALFLTVDTCAKLITAKLNSDTGTIH